MKSYLLSSIILFFAGNLIAQDSLVLNPSVVINLTNDKKSYDFVIPNQKLIAPETISTAEQVIVKVTDFDRPNYLVGVTYKWSVMENGKEKQVLVWPDGSLVFFNSGRTEGTRFTVILSAAYLYMVKEKEVVVAVGQRSQLFATTVVVTNSPNPPPPPGPGPGPTPPPNPPPPPDFPPGKYGLAKDVYNIAMKVKPESRRGGPALATVFAGIVSATRAGTIKTPEELLRKTTEANRAKLAEIGVPVTDWDNWAVELKTLVYGLYNTNKINTLDDFLIAWDEISSGLSKVK